MESSKALSARLYPQASSSPTSSPTSSSSPSSSHPSSHLHHLERGVPNSPKDSQDDRPSSTFRGRSPETLPPEILFLIAGHLDLHDKYLLSQSSRRFRALFSQDWEATVRDFNLDERIDYFEGIVRAKLELWACSECRQAHRVDLSDTPSRNGPDPAGHNLDRSDFNGYVLHQRHVQLVHKYTRKYAQLNEEQKQHLAGLMAPWQREDIVGALRRQHRIQPRLIDGSFVVEQRWLITHEHQLGVTELRSAMRNALSMLSLFELRICPHMSILAGNNIWSSPATGLRQAIRKLLLRYESKMLRRCEMCNTSAEFTLLPHDHRNCARISICIRNDFGGGEAL